jgi:hypothetical protein
VVALGCAEGLKEALLLRKLPQPSHLTTADTSLTMANPLFPFPDRLSSVFSALGEKANS